MKQFIILCLLAYAIPSIAQQIARGDVADLLKSGHFSFVVTKIEKKPGLNGSLGFKTDGPTWFGVPAGTTSIRESLFYTSNTFGPGSAYSQEYYKSAAGDGSYFSAFQIPLAEVGKEVIKAPVDKAVYFVQTNSDFLISKLDNPNTLEQIQNDGGQNITSKNISVKSSKKNDGIVLLTYKITDSDGVKKWYLEVMPDGKATLQTPPTRTEKTILSGYILNARNAE